MCQFGRIVACKMQQSMNMIFSSLQPNGIYMKHFVNVHQQLLINPYDRNKETFF